MFCSECGTKNNENAEFCIECGTRLGQQEKKVKEKKSSNGGASFKEFLKKNKIAVIIVSIVVVLIAAYFIINNTVYSAKKFALKYAEAVISKDVKSQIEYADVYGESDFVTKDVVNRKYKDQKLKNIEQIKVLSDSEVKKLATSSQSDAVNSALDKILGNTNATSTNGQVSSLTKSFVVEYITEGSLKSSYLTVVVTKSKNKNLLIFDNWKALGEDVISHDVVVKAEKNAKVTVDGVALSSKYLDKEESSSDEDVYNLGTVLKDNVLIGVSLSNGLEFTKTVDTYDKKSIDLTSYYSLDLSDKSSKQVSDLIKKFTEVYVGGAINNTDVATIKKDATISSSFAEEYSFDSDYNSLVSRYDSVGIESFKITDVSISSAYLNSYGVMSVDAKIKYDYKYSDSSTNTKKTGSTYKTITLKIDTTAKKLQISDGYTYSYKYMF